jgi:hypothetical protein
MKTNDQKGLEEAYNEVEAVERYQDVVLEADTYNRKEIYHKKGVYDKQTVKTVLETYDDCLKDLDQCRHMSKSWTQELKTSKEYLKSLECIKEMTNEEKDAVLVAAEQDSWLFEGLEEALYPTLDQYIDYLKYLELHFTKFGLIKQKLPELEGIF